MLKKENPLLERVLFDFFVCTVYVLAGFVTQTPLKHTFVSPICVVVIIVFAGVV